MRRAVAHLRASDPLLERVIHRVGPCRIQYRPPEFSTLVRSIVFQQVSGAAASTMLRRLEEAAGALTPKRLLTLSDEQMRAAGISQQKRTYIRDLAEQTLARRVRFPVLSSLPDEAVIEHLTRVKGVGVWTAQMFLIFALRRPDVLPTGDLGVRAAMKSIYGLEELPKPAEMERLAQPWRPWASVASWYLWRSLDGPAEI